MQHKFLKRLWFGFKDKRFLLGGLQHEGRPPWPHLCARQRRRSSNTFLSSFRRKSSHKVFSKTLRFLLQTSSWSPGLLWGSSAWRMCPSSRRRRRPGCTSSGWRRTRSRRRPWRRIGKGWRRWESNRSRERELEEWWPFKGCLPFRLNLFLMARPFPARTWTLYYGAIANVLVISPLFYLIIQVNKIIQVNLTI